MVVWSLIGLIVLIVVIYLVVRKILNEAKVRNGRNELAGKVRRKGVRVYVCLLV